MANMGVIAVVPLGIGFRDARSVPNGLMRALGVVRAPSEESQLLSRSERLSFSRTARYGVKVIANRRFLLKAGGAALTQRSTLLQIARSACNWL
jgi:hypothetical protein